MTKAEIEEQLRAMLKSKLFKSRPRQAQFLERVVTETLNGNEVHGKDLGYALFPNFVGDKNDVRVNAAHLRKTLETYYSTEGRGDFVFISVPQGSYVPQFDPNPDSLYQHEIDVASSHFKDSYPGDPRASVDAWKAAIAANPNDPRAYHLQAECLMMHALINCSGYSTNYLVSMANKFADHAIELDPNCYEAYKILGALRITGLDFHRALDAFRFAQTHSLSLTDGDPWFWILLLAMEREEEAVEAARAFVTINPDAHFVVQRCWYGILLYATRDYETALRQFQACFDLDPSDRSGCVWLAMMGAMLACQTIGDEAGIDQWRGLFFLSTRVPRQLGRGFLELFGSSLSDDLRQLVDMSDLDLVFTHMAKKEMDCASNRLARLMGTHPIVALAHLLPIFDPLRECYDFRALVSILEDLRNGRPPRIMFNF